MNKQSYGENYQNHLLEQYKLYVEMADRISARRIQINSFYISLLSGLLAILSIFGNKDILAKLQNTNLQYTMLFLMGLLGLILCWIWHSNIGSYKLLNSAKFKVITEIEKDMPFPIYEREWEILKKDKEYKVYVEQTLVEKYIPFILAIPYLILLIYSLIAFIR
ncbi:MAG: hypothetical protein RM022_004925 [Nostoc sp. EfeVER01]|uniref:RipA family octameric membrane protein n=1 Tax=unclassified Nostoc TaxID=2593658 RepID=UPI002AD3BDFB|nr:MULTISPECIES: hypothetical protein [unclassified Nostoc]MDZ7947833.1 hypothetical protein [Nostoc sp. EfeVER01]MDZ7994369.1 hypothetical protein [Nostoc sp. EspVER01]